MKKISIGSVLIILLLAVGGCKATGYNVRLETTSLDYHVIFQIETMLTDRGYNVKSKEELRYSGAAPNDVSSLFVKQFSKEEIIHGVDPAAKDIQKRYDEERFWTVLMTLSYLKDMPTNSVKHVDISIYNHFLGGNSPEIKAEIDNLGALIYQELVDKAGKENVKIEHKEWGPPQFY